MYVHYFSLKLKEKMDGGLCSQAWMGQAWIAEEPIPADRRLLCVLALCLSYKCFQIERRPGGPIFSWAVFRGKEGRRELMKGATWNIPPQSANKTPGCCSRPKPSFGPGVWALFPSPFPPHPLAALALPMHWAERGDPAAQICLGTIMSQASGVCGNSPVLDDGQSLDMPRQDTRILTVCCQAGELLFGQMQTLWERVWHWCGRWHPLMSVWKLCSACPVRWRGWNTFPGDAAAAGSQWTDQKVQLIKTVLLIDLWGQIYRHVLIRPILNSAI